MRVVGKRKITVGFVIQTFDDKGDCVDQEFVAADSVEWEDDNGECEFDEPEYSHEMLMVQPDAAETLKQLRATIEQYEADEYSRQMSEQE